MKSAITVPRIFMLFWWAIGAIAIAFGSAAGMQDGDWITRIWAIGFWSMCWGGVMAIR